VNNLLIKALKDIIEECPEPKLPYGIRVVEIATKALKDHSSGGYLDALLDLLSKWIEKHRQLEKYCLYERNSAINEEKRIRYEQRAEDSFHLIEELQQILKKTGKQI